MSQTQVHSTNFDNEIVSLLDVFYQRKLPLEDIIATFGIFSSQHPSLTVSQLVSLFEIRINRFPGIARFSTEQIESIKLNLLDRHYQSDHD